MDRASGSRLSGDGSSGSSASGSGTSGDNGRIGERSEADREAVRVALVVSTDTLDADEVFTFGDDVLGNVPEEGVALTQVVTKRNGSNDVGILGLAGQ